MDGASYDLMDSAARDGLNRLAQTGDLPIPLGDLEPGGINGQGAELHSASSLKNYLRTISFLPVEAGEVTVTTAAYTICILRFYDADKNGLPAENASFGSSSQDGSFSRTVRMADLCPGAVWYRAVLGVADADVHPLCAENVSLSRGRALALTREVEAGLSALSGDMDARLSALAAQVPARLFINTAALLSQYADFDALPKNSLVMYTVNTAGTALNAPDGFTSGAVLTLQTDNASSAVQLCFIRSSSRVAWRYKWSGWKPWNYLYSQSELDALLSAAAAQAAAPAPEYTALFRTVCCIGDSLTRGYQAEYPSGVRNRDGGYPMYLARLTGLTVYNFGASGVNPTQWLAQEAFAQADYSAMDLALICLGRNEGLSSQEDQLSYQLIIDRLLSANPDMTVFLLSLPPSDTSAETNARVNARIRAIAENNPGRRVFYLDIYENTLCASSSLRSDGTHYYPLGYFLLAQTVKNNLEAFIASHPESFVQLPTSRTWDNLITDPVS